MPNIFKKSPDGSHWDHKGFGIDQRMALERICFPQFPIKKKLHHLIGIIHQGQQRYCSRLYFQELVQLLRRRKGKPGGSNLFR